MKEKPVAFMTSDKRMILFADKVVGDIKDLIHLYERKTPLTDDEILAACGAIGSTGLIIKIARAVEKAHGII